MSQEELLSLAWVLICNASNRTIDIGPVDAPPGWAEAAVRFRKAYFEYLDKNDRANALEIPALKIKYIRKMVNKAWDAWEADEDNKYKLGFARGASAVLAELEEDQPIAFNMGADGWGASSE